MINPEVFASGARDPEQVARMWIDESSAFDLRRVDDDHVVANLVTADERLFASLGLTRIDGRWRTDSLSACTDDYPGLEAAEVFGSGLPLVELVAVNVGHCWIATLEYGGTEWDLRDEDQFGWGGLGPEGFLGVGSVRLSGEEQLDYTDLSGAQLTFVPADNPGTDVNEGGCA